MDTVFIDTSVFISENILEGKRIREIYRLVQEGHIRLILPVITFKEVLNRIRKNTTEAVSGYKAFRDKTKIIRNIPALEKRFDKLDEEATIKELQVLFETKIKSISTILIEYPTLNIGDVFEKYFESTFPFGSGEKKHEFPDAFAIATLEKWCQDNGAKCILIAGDKDLTQYKSTHFKIASSIGEYLDDKLRQIEIEQKRQKRLDRATVLFEEAKSRFKREIEQWLVEQLDDEKTYKRYTHHEIHDIKIDDAEAELDSFQIASVTEHHLIIESEVYVTIEVTIEVDDVASGWYDDDARNWHYTDTEYETIKKDFNLTVSFEVEFPLAGDEFMDIEISEINKGRDLEL